MQAETTLEHHGVALVPDRRPRADRRVPKGAEPGAGDSARDAGPPSFEDVAGRTLPVVYPRMIERGRGQIVNTASGAGLAAPPFVTAYAATKHAVVGLSQGLRPEARLHGVGVSALCPGSIDTAILDRPQDDDLPETASAPVSGRAYLTLLKQKVTSVDDFARKAIRQIARDRGLIVVPTQAKALWYVARVSPGLLERALVPVARRVQRELVRARD